MKIVIEIPDESYNNIHSLKWVMSGLHSEENRQMFYRLINAVQGGTPLPEHHGRLIDADNMIERLHSENGMPRTRNEEYAWDFAVELFKKAPTIIEGSDSE